MLKLFQYMNTEVCYNYKKWFSNGSQKVWTIFSGPDLDFSKEADTYQTDPCQTDPARPTPDLFGQCQHGVSTKNISVCVFFSVVS